MVDASSMAGLKGAGVGGAGPGGVSGGAGGLTGGGLYGLRVADAFRGVPDATQPPRAPALGFIQDTSAHGLAHIVHSRGEWVLQGWVLQGWVLQGWVLQG